MPIFQALKDAFTVTIAPLSLLYGFGVSLFTLGYTLGLVKSSKFNIPIISIGNLTIGGYRKDTTLST